MGAGRSNYFVIVSVFNLICLAIKHCYFCFTELAKIHFYVSLSMTCNTGKLCDLTYETISENKANITEFTLLSVNNKNHTETSKFRYIFISASKCLFVC